MKKKQLKEMERNLMWRCFEETIPEQLGKIDNTFSIAKDIKFSANTNEELDLWMLEKEGGSIIFISDKESVLGAILSESCHEDVSVGLLNLNEIEKFDETELVNTISVLCRVFVAGNWHTLMDYLCGDEKWKIALKAYLCFEEAHPEIAHSITYFAV